MVGVLAARECLQTWFVFSLFGREIRPFQIWVNTVMGGPSAQKRPKTKKRSEAERMQVPQKSNTFWKRKKIASFGRSYIIFWLNQLLFSNLKMRKNGYLTLKSVESHKASWTCRQTDRKLQWSVLYGKSGKVALLFNWTCARQVRKCWEFHFNGTALKFVDWDLCWNSFPPWCSSFGSWPQLQGPINKPTQLLQRSAMQITKQQDNAVCCTPATNGHKNIHECKCCPAGHGTPSVACPGIGPWNVV